MGSQRVRYDWATNTHTLHIKHKYIYFNSNIFPLRWLVNSCIVVNIYDNETKMSILKSFQIVQKSTQSINYSSHYRLSPLMPVSKGNYCYQVIFCMFVHVNYSYTQKYSNQTQACVNADILFIILCTQMEAVDGHNSVFCFRGQSIA